MNIKQHLIDIWSGEMNCPLYEAHQDYYGEWDEQCNLRLYRDAWCCECRWRFLPNFFLKIIGGVWMRIDVQREIRWEREQDKKGDDL